MFATEFIKKCLQLMSTTAAQKIMSVRGEFLPDKTKGLYCQDEFLKNIFNPNNMKSKIFRLSNSYIN